MAKLPKNPVKGKKYKLLNPKTKRTTCFIATGKPGFGKFKICKCSEPGSKVVNPRVPQGSNFHPSVGWY